MSLRIAYGTVVSRLGIYSGSDDVRGTRISYVCESVHLQITILFVFSVRVPGALGGARRCWRHPSMYMDSR